MRWVRSAARGATGPTGIATLLTSLRLFEDDHEMFTRVASNSVESTDGFSVTVNHSELVYSEKGRSARADVEAGDDALDVYASAIQVWEDDDDREIGAMSSEDQQRVAQNISDALNAMGIRFVIN